MVEGNLIFGNGSTADSEGLNVSSPFNITVKNNRVSGHVIGMGLSYGSVDSSFRYNIIEDNTGSGIRIRIGEDHVVEGNLVFNNSGYGIECVDSSGCMITDNTFINNYGSGDTFNSLKIQASEREGKNKWNATEGGNYWRDWASPDNDGDGLVDLPYLIFGSISYDQKALAEPSYTYLTEPESFSATASKDRILLSWESPEFDLDGSLNGFRLFRTGGEGPDRVIDLGPTVFHYTDEEVSDGVSYQYHMRGYNRYGVGRSTVILEAVPDSVPPEIEFLSPANGSVISTSEVELSWNVTDNVKVQMVEISSDGVIWQDLGTNETFTASNLPEGLNTFFLRAFDAQGNNATRSLELTVDTLLPGIHIVSPGNGTATNLSNVLIEWEGDDATTGIAGYGRRVDEGAWQNLALSMSDSVSLSSEGLHTIYIRAEDMAGNTAIDSIQILLDQTGPDVFFKFPAEGYNTTDRTFEVKWAAYDPLSGLSGFGISVDGGSSLELSYNVTSFSLTSLSAGNHAVAITAYDNAGNWNTVEVTFKIIEEDIDQTTTVIKGRVFDEKGEPVHKAMVIADTGDYTYTDSSGRFSLEVEMGQRTLTITRKGFVSFDISVDASSTEIVDLENITLEEKEDEEESRIWENTYCQICCILLIGIPLLLMLLGLLARARRKSKKRKKQSKKNKMKDIEE
jgi:parallel beta-helix repeat protein